jgi:glyoxylase-like metal-dependent hydrolase (beta-lactamase superfamily II)
MATAAEPRPASLPLPGGQDGATVRLEPLLTGTSKGPPGFFLRQEGRLAWRKGLGLGVPRSQWWELPIPAFLIHHPGAGPVLVDTGLHASVAVKPAANLGRISTFVFKDLKMQPEQAVSAQLRERGIAASDVGTVIITHLHTDHASAIADFPESTFVVSSAEWAAATEQGPLHGYVRRQFDHAFDYRTLDFDGPDTSSFSGFGRTFDIFGDGSVRVAFTPGHTLGHMSVILRLKQREVLLAGDAIYLERNLADQQLPYRTEDDHLYSRSLREMELYRREAPDALIVPGHDIEHWHTLDAVYE